MHILNQEFINDEEPDRPTPCLYDPERWQPDEQEPDPAAVAACWSCYFQPRCARRALKLNSEFGIWAGYRLAPGPGLARSRRQLRVVAGLEIGPPRSPGGAASAELERQAQVRADGNAANTTASAESHAPDAVTVRAGVDTSAETGAEIGELGHCTTEPGAMPNTAAVVVLRVRHTTPRCRRRQPVLAAADRRVPARVG
jgi:hypothetical protein